MVSLKEAYTILQSQTLTPKIQEVQLFEALHQILAEDIFCQRDLPAFNNSAMDGYVVSEIAQSYEVLDSILAGEAAIKSIPQGKCYKIMTGAIIPSNAIAVIPFENANLNNNTMQPTLPISPNQHIRFQGEDYKPTQPLLLKSQILDYSSLSLLASQGIHTIKIYQKPKIAIFASGDELKEPWEEAQPHQIYNTNGIIYHSLLQSFGFQAQYLGILPDDKATLQAKIQSFQDFDIVFTSGGASMGEADFFREILQTLGAEFLIDKIKLKPGHPTLIAKLNQTLIFSLPGNPLSGALNLITLAIPTLFSLTSNSPCFIQSIKAINQESFSLKPNRSNMILGYFDGTTFKAHQQGKYSSGSLSPLFHSNAIAIFTPEVSEVLESSHIHIIPIPHTMGIQQKIIFNEKLNFFRQK